MANTVVAADSPKEPVPCADGGPPQMRGSLSTPHPHHDARRRPPRRRSFRNGLTDSARPAQAPSFSHDVTSMQWYKENRRRHPLLRIIHPYSRFRRTWDLCTTLASLCLLWQVPLHLVFEAWIPPVNVIERLSEALLVPSEVIRALTVAFFLVDIVISVRTGYVNRAGEVIMDGRKIALRYLLRWLIVDLIAMLPLETLFPEDHARVSYLGPYQCRRHRGLRTVDSELLYCERRLSVGDKIRNTLRVLRNIRVGRLVQAAREQRVLIPTLRAVPAIVRRVCRTISLTKRIKWFKLGRLLQVARLLRAALDRGRLWVHRTRLRLEADRLRRRQAAEARRAARAQARAIAAEGSGGAHACLSPSSWGAALSPSSLSPWTSPPSSPAQRVEDSELKAASSSDPPRPRARSRGRFPGVRDAAVRRLPA